MAALLVSQGPLLLSTLLFVPSLPACNSIPLPSIASSSTSLDFVVPFLFFSFSFRALSHSPLVKTCAFPVLMVPHYDVLGAGTFSRSAKGDLCGVKVDLAID